MPDRTRTPTDDELLSQRCARSSHSHVAGTRSCCASTRSKASGAASICSRSARAFARGAVVTPLDRAQRVEHTISLSLFGDGWAWRAWSLHGKMPDVAQAGTTFGVSDPEQITGLCGPAAQPIKLTADVSVQKDETLVRGKLGHFGLFVLADLDSEVSCARGVITELQMLGGRGGREHYRVTIELHGEVKVSPIGGAK